MWMFLTESGERGAPEPLSHAAEHRYSATRREARRPLAADTPRSQVSPTRGRGGSRAGAAARRLPERGSPSAASSPPPFGSGRAHKSPRTTAGSFQGLKNKFEALSCESQPHRVPPGNVCDAAEMRRESPERPSLREGRECWAAPPGRPRHRARAASCREKAARPRRRPGSGAEGQTDSPAPRPPPPRPRASARAGSPRAAPRPTSRLGSSSLFAAPQRRRRPMQMRPRRARRAQCL